MKKLRAIVISLAVLVGAAGGSDRAAAVSEARSKNVCNGWIDLASFVGWREKELETLRRVLFRESRCMPNAFNPNDPMGGSHGLLQINSFWCKPTRYWPEGYLQAFGIVDTCQDLYEPAKNLRAGLLIWNYANRSHGNGWSPWSL